MNRYKFSISILFLLINISILYAQQNIPFSSDSLSVIESKAYNSIILKSKKLIVGNNYDIKYHRLNWTINPDTLFIKGEVFTYFKAKENIADYIEFEISKYLTIDSIKYHNVLINYYHDTINEIIKIFLSSPILINNYDSVSVFYHGSPKSSGFGSFRKGYHNNIPIICTLSEPYGAKDWWPCKNDLSDKIDSFDIFINIPNIYKAASNGKLIEINISNIANYIIYHWKHKYPIASYLIALSVTNYTVFTDYVVYNNDSLPVVNYVYPENYNILFSDAKGVLPVIKLYDSLFIMYPFQKEKYGHAQFLWGGGMEHQTMSFMGNLGFELMAHELAHQWFGDYITCSSWHDIWLNEGFATYLSGLTYENMFGGYWWNPFKKQKIAHITSKPDGSVYCYDTTSISRIFDGRLTYNKGAMILHMLRWIIGDSAFFKGMKNYLNDTSYSYGYVTFQNFKHHMETSSNKDLTEYFDNWYYNQGFPTYNIKYSKIDDGLKFVVNQTQSHNSVSYFKLPIQLKLKNSIKDTLIVLNNTYNGQEFYIKTNFIPDSVFFDPNYWLISANNSVTDITDYQNFKLSVFPNPGCNYLLIKNVKSQIKNIEISDIQGKIVNCFYSIDGSNIKVFIKNLNQGMYFIKIYTNNKVYSVKFTKECNY